MAFFLEVTILVIIDKDIYVEETMVSPENLTLSKRHLEILILDITFLQLIIYVGTAIATMT